MNRKRLSQFTVIKSKNGDYEAWDTVTQKQLHGLNALNIINAHFNRNKKLDRKANKLAYEALHHFAKINMKVCKLLLNKSNNVASNGILFDLLSNSICSGKTKKDGITSYPALYKVHATFKGLRKKYKVGNSCIENLFKALRETGLGIAHYGKIIFSPALIYNKSSKYYVIAYKYYEKLFINYKLKELKKKRAKK